jgi:hypothetical protein
MPMCLKVHEKSTCTEDQPPAIPGRNQEITLDAGEGRRFEKDWSFMAFLNASPGEKTT